MVHLGANACIIGRNVEKTENMAKDIATARSGAKVIGIGAVDVRKPELLQQAADRCAKELGSIDFVIAGAAGNFLATIDQISPNAMKSVIDIDVLGSYNTVKATLPYLVESAGKHRTDGKTLPPNGTGGRIIFVSATLHYAGTPLQSHVSVAKAGVDAMAMSIAIEQGPKGITSNVIAPGPIADTEGMERLSKKGNQERQYKAVPIGRYGTVKEIADATVYLFSDSGNFVNGETLVGEYLETVRRKEYLLMWNDSRRRTVAYGRLRERIHVPRFPALGRHRVGCIGWQEVKAVDDVSNSLLLAHA
jgi:peroxisomal 2,4-dienoyl-CoA reductase